MYAMNLLISMSKATINVIKPVCFIVVLFLFTLMACSKYNAINKNILNSIWVEESLKLDTLDFEVANRVDYGGPNYFADFIGKPLFDSAVIPAVYTVNSFSFDYYVANDKIYILPLISSTTTHQPFKIEISADGKKMTIDKFYRRIGLSASLVFVKQ